MSAVHAPNQIQGRVATYVNHQDDLAEAERFLRSGAGNLVIQIASVPGCGKTATAIELYFRVKDDYPDGSLVANLSASADQAGAERDVLRDWLLALGVSPDLLPTRLEALQAMFRDRTAGRRMVLLLDGVVSASQVEMLIPGDGGSLVLVTEGRPLTLRTAGTPHLMELSPLEPAAARELLVRLIGADRFEAEKQAAGEIIELCERLPVALCVVGAMVSRSRIRTLASTAERLRDERRRLTVLLPVDAVFTAAYRLLGDAAQLCYLELGLAPSTGEISVGALSATLDLPDYEIAEAVTELVDARLAEPVDADESRLVVRELVRLHAQRIDERPEAERTAQTALRLDFYFQRSLDADLLLAPARPWRKEFFPELAASAEAPFGNAEQAREWLRLERANIAAAVKLAADRGDHERVVRWCVLLWMFCEKEKLPEFLLATHELGLVSAAGLGLPDVESLLLVQQSYAHRWLDRFDAASDDLGRAVELARTKPVEATAVEAAGLLERDKGNRDAARDLLRRNLELARAIEDGRRIAVACLLLSTVEESATALALAEEADAEFVSLGESEIENHAKALLARGRALSELAAWEHAAAALNESLRIMSFRNRPFDVAAAHLSLGDLHAGTGERDSARSHYEQAEQGFRVAGFENRVAEAQARIRRLS